MSALVFMDTETTGLALTDDIWEFAGIRREDDGSGSSLHLFIQHSVEKCHRLPSAFHADHGERWDEKDSVSRQEAAKCIAPFMAGAHIVGAVPNFDTERIALMLRQYSLTPEWHYHLIDVENLAVGYVMGLREATGATGVRDIPLPWDSDRLSHLVGVEPPGAARHTAMGDARWAMAIYDRVTGGAS